MTAVSAVPTPRGIDGGYREFTADELDPDHEPLWVDIAALLAGGLPKPPQPISLRRQDGPALFYAAKTNVLFGDPESGKSWIAYAACAEALRDGRKAAIIDVDHNGAAEVVGRLLALGAPRLALIDPATFRYCEPEDGLLLTIAADELREWAPAVAVVDSIGEVLPMLGLSSNSPDDYTTGNRRILSRIASSGAVVIGIDHLPKGEEARVSGPTGTIAKRRTVNGVSIRVTVAEPFTPGRGGKAWLSIGKDRPGGPAGRVPPGKNPPAGTFAMKTNEYGGLDWVVFPPSESTEATGGAKPDDVAALDELSPPPENVRDVKERMKWGSDRASRALAAWSLTTGGDQ